jgi:hypothetical protein
VVSGILLGVLGAWVLKALTHGLVDTREVVAKDGSKSKEPGFCESWCGNPRRKVTGKLAQLGFTPDRIFNEMW